MSNIFSQCAPIVRTNIGQCGSLTVCTGIKPATANELDTLYKSDTRFRITEALFSVQIEGKMCGVRQYGLRDFLIANTRDVRKSIQLDAQERGLIKIRPFLLMRQKVPVNNHYWRVENVLDIGSDQYELRLRPPSGIPADQRFFSIGERVYVEYESALGGSKRLWQGVVRVVNQPSGETISIEVESQNDGSAFEDGGAPTANAILRRGTANVGKSESFCDNEPGLINTKLVPFWLEHTRFALCRSSEYDQMRQLLVEGNPLFAQFYDLPEVEENRQRTEAFWNKWTNNLFFGKPISRYQNVNEYTQLPQILNYASPANLGVGGGRCAGYKANTIGWFEQLKRCGRFYDAQNQQLDLWSLMNAIYKLVRVRMSVGSPAATSIDLITDSTTAELLDRAFILLYKEVTADTMRTSIDVTAGENKAFGWRFKSYLLRGKCSGITLNVITEYAFDDILSEWTDLGRPNQGRWILLLDWSGIYPGIVETTRKTAVVGERDRLAQLDEAYACVEETETKRVTLTGVTYSAIAECPLANLVITNFNGEVPKHSISGDHPDYAPASAELYY